LIEVTSNYHMISVYQPFW